MTTQTEIKTVVPVVAFPAFPLLDGAYAISDTETAVPNSWIFKLAEYRILIEETQENYEKLRKLYTKLEEQK